MHGLRVAIAQQAHGAPLAPDAAFLVAAENGLRHGPLAAVDEDAAGFELVADAEGALDVFAPDAGAQARVGRVGPGDDFGLGRPWLAGHDGTCGVSVPCLLARGGGGWEEGDGERRTKGLFGDDFGVAGRVVDDGWLDEKPLARFDHVGTGGEFVPVRLAVREELRHLFVLHLVLDRAQHHAFVLARAHFERLGEFHHRLHEGLVDGFVDVDPLRRHAHLARVHEGAKGHLRRHFLNVHVRAHDAGVVAAELQRHPLEGLGRLRHDFLARGDAAGEADLLDTGVADEPGAEFLVPAENLQHAGRED